MFLEHNNVSNKLVYSCGFRGHLRRTMNFEKHAISRYEGKFFFIKIYILLKKLSPRGEGDRHDRDAPLKSVTVRRFGNWLNFIVRH